MYTKSKRNRYTERRNYLLAIIKTDDACVFGWGVCFSSPQNVSLIKINELTMETGKQETGSEKERKREKGGGVVEKELEK